MASVSVTTDDIDVLTTALTQGTLPASDLLAALVDAIRAAADDDQPVTVDVEVVSSLPETFDAAFTPEPLPDTSAIQTHGAGGAAAGHQVHVRVQKIGR